MKKLSILVAFMMVGCGTDWIVPFPDPGVPVVCTCNPDDGEEAEFVDTSIFKRWGWADLPDFSGTPDAGKPTVDGGTPPKTCKKGYTFKDGKCHKDSCDKVDPPDDTKCGCSKPGHGKGTGHCKGQPKTHSNGHGNGHCKYDCN